MNADQLWQRFQQYLITDGTTGISLDISRMRFGDDYFSRMENASQKAMAAMRELEAGGIVNPDEKRQVGHYWLRDAALAPTEELRATISKDLSDIKAFAAAVHKGEIKAAGGEPFKNVLVVGIGGSALGPQLVADSLGSTHDRLTPYFLDNTDPDGFDRVFARLGDGSEANPRARDLEVGRHQGDAQRHARDAGAFSGSWASRSRRSSWRSPARTATWISSPCARVGCGVSRCTTGWAGGPR